MTREEALRIVFEQLGYIEGLMEALVQPAQEPVVQPAQEPVAWYGKDAAFPNKNKIFVFNNKDDANAYGLRKSVSIKPLYTHPAD